MNRGLGLCWKNWSIGIKERDVAESKEKSNLKQAKKQRNYKKTHNDFGIGWDFEIWKMKTELDHCVITSLTWTCLGWG